MKESERKTVRTLGQYKKTRVTISWKGKNWSTILQYLHRIHILIRYFQHAHFIPIVGVGKRGQAYINWSMVAWPAKAASVRNYLEVYWPCAGGLSAVNAIGTRLRDPNDKLGTDPMAHGGFINGRRRGTREESRK